MVRFEDGSELEVDAVIWASGYRPNYSWIELPAFDPDGRLRHRRGITDVPGLYCLGLTWQHTRGSALIGWVKDDAAFIAEQIETFYDRPNKPADVARESGDEVVALGEGTGAGQGRDQAGVWMAHCHIAEHHESVMMFSFDVLPANAV
jgi:hypothetical protein